MTDDRAAGPRRASVQIFLDGEAQPIAEHQLPTRITLDTTALADGAHRIRMRATDDTGRVSVLDIAFKVRNGPGVSVTGLVPNTVRRGVIEFGVNAFSADEPFEPERAETHSSIPVWVWVMTLAIVAWAAWYGASLWQVPAQYAATPTYAVDSTAGLTPRVGH